MSRKCDRKMVVTEAMGMRATTRDNVHVMCRCQQKMGWDGTSETGQEFKIRRVRKKLQRSWSPVSTAEWSGGDGHCGK